MLCHIKSTVALFLFYKTVLLFGKVKLICVLFISCVRLTEYELSYSIKYLDINIDVEFET